MVDYFEKIIFPALKNELFKRKSKTCEHYLTDVKIVNLADELDEPQLALVGIHIRRLLLEIKHDYIVEQGFIPIGETKYSAPYSTFILLLKNHRLIQFKDQAGSPDVRSLGATVREFIRQYRNNAIREVRRFIFDGIEPSQEVKNMIDMNKETLQMPRRELRDFLKNQFYPEPEINVVPIPSPNIIEQKMKYIKSIQQVNFRVYPLNSELDFSGFYKSLRTATTELNAPSGQAVFNGPKDINSVGDYLKESKGMADFIVYARSETEKLKLSPDELIENIQLSIPEGAVLEEQAKYVYSKVKDREEIAMVSDENRQNYKKYLDRS